jgi:hypothetical protein
VKEDGKMIKVAKYEVIAAFPAMMFDVGDVVEVYEDKGMIYMVEVDDSSEKYDVRDYPHLFKKIDA